MLKLIRQIHLYLGIFISPALLFFALTGALQTFDLHEPSHDGGTYKPAGWIAALGQLHKKQTITAPQRRPQPQQQACPAPTAAAPQPEGEHHAWKHDDSNGTEGSDHPHHHHADGGDAAQAAPQQQQQPRPQQPQHHTMPMKIFFLIVSIGLFLSTVTGIYMSYKYRSNKLAVTSLLVLGTALPILFAIIGK